MRGTVHNRAMPRDPSEYSEASVTPDMAGDCDTLEQHVSEVLSSQLKQFPAPTVAKLSRIFVKVLRQLLDEERLGSLVDIKKLSGRELLARLIAEIIDAPQPQLMACCVDFTFALGVQTGRNETQIAADHNVTKATVSRYCVHLKTTYLGGVPAPGMKSAKAVESYRQNKLGRSSRPPMQEWAFGKVLKETYERRT